ncbi:hypothetical protein EYF80_007743 [Liparis tanakae]|uniref:Uncharacterized protein n=1 Tax=Liparis tanakae TaxID=230148 RepID=A0A4Z2IWG0_9TELE|nr:hypothetical protein EYF80_007743 [Liparis tanakae]
MESDMESDSCKWEEQYGVGFNKPYAHSYSTDLRNTLVINSAMNLECSSGGFCVFVTGGCNYGRGRRSVTAADLLPAEGDESVAS